MAPQAAQRAALQKYRGAYSRAIVDRILLYIHNQSTFHYFLPLPNLFGNFSFSSSILFGIGRSFPKYISSDGLNASPARKDSSFVVPTTEKERRFSNGASIIAPPQLTV